MTFREFLEALGRVWHGPRVPTPPPPAPRPLPTPKPPPADPPGLARDLLALHNDLRQRHGLGALKLDGRLIASAMRESLDCAKQRRLSHTSSDGSDPFQRIREAGYSYSWAGENIAAGQVTPEAAFAAWQSDPPHLANILNPHFVAAGFAVAYDTTGFPYWTADFGAPA